MEDFTVGECIDELIHRLHAKFHREFMEQKIAIKENDKERAKACGWKMMAIQEFIDELKGR